MCIRDSINIADTNLSYRLDIAAPWERLGEKIQVTGKMGHLISGRKILAPFADKDYIQGFYYMFNLSAYTSLTKIL